MLSHPDILACRHLDEDNGHCERSKSRKEERRWSREEDDARQMEKTDFSEREKSYEENGRKSTSLGELEDGGRYEKWRDEALAKTNFSPVAFLMEEMEVEEEEEMEKEEEERRKKRREETALYISVVTVAAAAATTAGESQTRQMCWQQ